MSGHCISKRHLPTISGDVMSSRGAVPREKGQVVKAEFPRGWAHDGSSAECAVILDHNNSNEGADSYAKRAIKDLLPADTGSVDECSEASRSKDEIKMRVQATGFLAS